MQRLKNNKISKLPFIDKNKSSQLQEIESGVLAETKEKKRMKDEKNA